MRGFEILARALGEQGATVLFGLAGDANLFFIDDAVRNQGVRYVPVAHEAAAVSMALGYSRVTGDIGVATVTHGPAFTNTITALIEGVRSHTPMVLIAGDTNDSDEFHPQWIEQQPFALAAGAGFELVTVTESIPSVLARAWWRARVEQRPIVVNVPIEHQWSEAKYQEPVRTWPATQRPLPDPEALDEVLGVIASARRPIILAGRGALEARDQIIALADMLGAPLSTTAIATSLFRGHPANIGIFGGLSHAMAVETINAADCVIAFGANLHEYTTEGGDLLAGKSLIVVDVNERQFARTSVAGSAVLGDAGAVADAIRENLELAEHASTGFADESMKHRLGLQGFQDEYVDLGTSETIDPRTLTAAIDDAFPVERTVVVDVGRFMVGALKMPVPEPRAMVSTHGFQSIGLGTAAAVGAAVGRPDRPTLALIGDGGFMMGGLAEFQAAVRLGVDLVVVIYNDGSYGAEHIQFHLKNMDPQISLNEWPALADVAVALGGAGITVRSRDDLDHLRNVIAQRESPLLIDAHLDPQVMSEYFL